MDAPAVSSLACVSVDARGRRLLAGYADGTIVLWNVNNGEALRTREGLVPSVTCLAFHGYDSSRPLVGGSWGGHVVLLRDGALAAPSGSPVGSPPPGPTPAASPPPRRSPVQAASGGHGGSGGGARRGRRLLAASPMTARRASGSSGSVSPRRPRSPEDGWSRSQGDARMVSHPGSDVLCVACGYSPVRDSYIAVAWVVTGHADGSVVCWNAASGQQVSRHEVVDPKAVNSAGVRSLGLGFHSPCSLEKLCWLGAAGVVVMGCNTGTMHALHLQHDRLVLPPLAPATGILTPPRPARPVTGVLPEPLLEETVELCGAGIAPAVTSMCDGGADVLFVGLQRTSTARARFKSLFPPLLLCAAGWVPGNLAPWLPGCLAACVHARAERRVPLFRAQVALCARFTWP